MQSLEWYKKYRRKTGVNWNVLANEAFTANDAKKKKLAKQKAQAALKIFPKTSNRHLKNLKSLLTNLAE